MPAPHSTYEPMMASLAQKRDRLLEELRAVESALEALRTAQNAVGFDAANATPPDVADDLNGKEPKGEANAAKPVIFKDLTMPQAVFEALKRAEKALVAKDILGMLNADNAAPTGDGPVKKVQVALKRRAEKQSDIVHIGWGEWGLRKWYTLDQLEKFAALIDGAHARDKRTHRKRMKEGIRKAQERGAHYGGPPKITPEQWTRALELAAEGATTMTAIHREIIKLTPKGEKPMVFETIRKYRDKLFAGGKYPERWQAYFDHINRDRNPGGDQPKMRVVN